MSNRGKLRRFPEIDQFIHRITRANARAAQVQAEAPPQTFTATTKQVEFMAAVRSGRFTIMGIGGGIRGTKTIAVLAVLVVLCRIFPRSRWAIVRKDLPTLRRNVIPSMEKIRLWSGGFVGELNQSTWSYPCANGAVIILFAEQITRDPDLERWKGLEVNGFVLEEGNELKEKSANKAIERAGSYVIPALPEDPAPRQPPPLIMVTFNPCREWPRKWFFEPFRAGTLAAPYYFLPVTIKDNPFAGEAYQESLKRLPPEEYKRFVEGEWDFIDNPHQLIKTEWVWDARNVEGVDGPLRMGADIARYGDDNTSLYVLKGNQLWRHTTIKHFDLIKVSKSIMLQAFDPVWPIEGGNIRVDGVGLGAGVVDYCRSEGLNVIDVIAGAKPIERPGSFFKFRDLRSQIWWEGREKFRLGQVCLYWTDGKGNELPIPQDLVDDLTSVEYEISGDKVITVESKETLKSPKRLGRSPDDGDAFMMSLFDFPPAPKRPILPGSAVVRGH